MVTPELQKKIDENWDACWPLSQLKPIIILDLISYLFFYKKISEKNLAFRKTVNVTDSSFSQIDEPEPLNWNAFKNLDAKAMQEIFTQQDGIIDLLKNSKNSIFHEFTKGDLLLTPTPKLLAKSVEIIKIMDLDDENTQAEIFEYLLNKIEIIAPNGQVYLPNYIANLIVSIIQPVAGDIILDPAIGNGNVLVSCAKYTGLENGLNNFDTQKFVGFESNLSNFRISGMNLLLNGIKNPNLETGDPLSSSGFIVSVSPDIIISNLIFSATENAMTVEGDSIKESVRKEILYLNSILKNSRSGAHMAIIVPTFILYNVETPIKSVRQDIIDNFNLASIIYLDDKNYPNLLGSAILIFSKEPPGTNKIWLYKLKQSKKSKTDNLHSLNEEDDLTDKEEREIILSHFKNEMNDETKNSHGIFISAAEMMANNYSFNYNEYNLFKREKRPESVTQVNLVEKKVPISETRKHEPVVSNENKFVTAEKIIEEPVKRSGKKIISIVGLLVLVLCIAFGGYWFFSFKKNQSIEKSQAIIAPSNKDSSKDSIALNTLPAADTNKIVKADSPESLDLGDKKFTVISKAYFYSSPNENSKEKIYIDHWSNSILTPEKEENGFIYVVYDNNTGQILKGWLNKKDLQNVH